MAVQDNGPVIVSVTWFLCFFSGGFLALRLYAKISRRQGLWWDDYILIFSWFMLLIESALTQAGQILGFGKHTVDIPTQNLMIIALGTSIAASVSCFASTGSKISFGVTLLRLTSGQLRAFVWFCIISLFAVMLPSATLQWLQCRPLAKAWNSSLKGDCWDARVVVYYGIFNAAWCAWADFALALIPWKLIWRLRLSIREKIGIGIAMSMGLLAGVCAIIKGIYMVQLREQDFFYNGIDVTIWTAVETATAIVGASIPVLRVFFISTNSSLHNHHQPQAGSKNIPMSRFNSRSNGTHGKSKIGDDMSERSILGDNEEAGMVIVEDNGPKYGGILQTSTVTVKYEQRVRSNASSVPGIGKAV